MKDNIKYIGENPSIPSSSFQEFRSWVTPLKEIQFDIETIPANKWIERELVTLQFGDVEGKEIWVMEIWSLVEEDAAFIKEILESDEVLKLIHNASFECTVLLFYDIKVRNIYDTILAEKILVAGYEKESSYYSLASTVHRYFGITLDKTLQTSFNLDIPYISIEQLIYAADDVKYLGKIRVLQMEEIEKEEMQAYLDLENKAVEGFSEMTNTGMLMDPEKWLSNMELAIPLEEAARKKLDAWLLTEEFIDTAIATGVLSRHDEILFNYNSNTQRKQLLGDLFSYLPDFSKGMIRGFFKKLENSGHPHRRIFLPILESGDTSEMEEYLHTHHREYLIEKGWLVPAMTPTINWNSPVQRLAIFQAVEPHLESTSQEALAETSHPIIEDYQEYIKEAKLISTYGEAFLEKHLEPDGRVRTNFNQVLSTGRVSSSKPNMQQIPNRKEYRNAFIAPEGWSFVGADYSSQELNIVAYISQDPVWLDALKKGKDLHSVTAELVFGKTWEDAAEENCQYYALNDEGVKKQSKCKCPAHQDLRDNVKTLNFGLIYGMSKFKYARSRRISVEEAADFIELYFTTFPSIKKALDLFAEFGVEHGFITTIEPFYRKRYFPMWTLAQPHHIEQHIQQIKNPKKGRYHTILGSIERQSRNLPIQGTAADMVKLAIVMLVEYIWKHNLRHKVKLALQVHDEIQSLAVDEYAEEWKVIFNDIMTKAAKVIITNGLLKAETKISKVWDK